MHKQNPSVNMSSTVSKLQIGSSEKRNVLITFNFVDFLLEQLNERLIIYKHSVLLTHCSSL